MSYYTFLLIVEATVEGPDVGEAETTLATSLDRQGRWLHDTNGEVVGYLHETEPYGRWWQATPIEAEVLRREQNFAPRWWEQPPKVKSGRPKKKRARSRR